MKLKVKFHFLLYSYNSDPFWVFYFHAFTYAVLSSNLEYSFMHRKTESDHCECQISGNCKYLLRGTGTRQECLTHSFCVFNVDNEPRGPSTLSWRVSPWLWEWSTPTCSTLKLCRVCCSSWTSTNLWGLIGFLKELDGIMANPILIYEQSW